MVSFDIIYMSWLFEEKKSLRSDYEPREAFDRPSDSAVSTPTELIRNEALFQYFSIGSGVSRRHDPGSLKHPLLRDQEARISKMSANLLDTPIKYSTLFL